MTPKQRYIEANKSYMQRELPNAWKDGHWFEPDIPNVRTSNGLTSFICKFLFWSGHNAVRINVAGRLIEKAERQASGVELMTKKFIKSSTRVGQADIRGTIFGRSIQIEVKVNKDRPSPAQLKEQERERRAGGVYEFIKTPEEFISWYDSFILSLSKQSSLF